MCKALISDDLIEYFSCKETKPTERKYNFYDRSCWCVQCVSDVIQVLQHFLNPSSVHFKPSHSRKDTKNSPGLGPTLITVCELRDISPARS